PHLHSPRRVHGGAAHPFGNRLNRLVFTDQVSNTSGDIPALPLFFTAAMLGTVAYYRHLAQIRTLDLGLNQLNALDCNVAGAEVQIRRLRAIFKSWRRASERLLVRRI